MGLRTGTQLGPMKSFPPSVRAEWVMFTVRATGVLTAQPP
jgi:hypothetical protein